MCELCAHPATPTPTRALAWFYHLVCAVFSLNYVDLLTSRTSIIEVGAGIMSVNPIDVMFNKGTEPAFSGRYNAHKGYGSYHCAHCGEALFHSADKFDSGSGWPSFDDALAHKNSTSKIREVPEPDAADDRVEIVCNRCKAHMGHVFRGEKMTPKSTRHCVNSASLEFREWAYFAGGCFWGLEHLLEQEEGVYEVVSGYMGGRVANPRWEEDKTSCSCSCGGVLHHVSNLCKSVFAAR